MGAGKTTIGRVLARKLGWRFVDSDHEIERRTGVSIPTIFEIEGEAGFRDRETRILEELLDQPRIVLATGGGAILREENRRILRERGTVCYLKAHPQTLYHRTRNDRSRPLLRVDDPLAKLTELLSQRGPLYEATSDLTIEVERWTTKEIVEQLAGLPIFLS